MANTIIYQALWENKLAQRLDKPQNWKEVNDVVYSDTQAYNFPLVSTANEPAVATLTNTAAGRSTLTNVIPFIDVTETNQTLSIITAEIDSVYLDYADQAQSNYAKMAEMGTLLGKKIGERAEAISLANHGSWTNIGDNGGGAVGLTTTTLTISANNVDDVVRGVIEQIYTANGFNLYKENGVDYLGLNHYVSTAHTAGHVMGGVRGVQKFGILKSTFGKTYTNEMPAYTASGGGSAGGSLSGTQIHTRLDYGLLVPTNLLPVIYDINVA